MQLSAAPAGRYPTSGDLGAAHVITHSISLWFIDTVPGLIS